MKIHPIRVIPPNMKNIPGEPMLLWTINSMVMAFSSRLKNKARTQSPRAVSTATSAAYIQAMGP